MPVDRQRLRRVALFWTTRVVGTLLLGAVLTLMVTTRPEASAPGPRVFPIVAAGAVGVLLLVVAHFLQPEPSPPDPAAALPDDTRLG
jgi:hypothetical protein